MRWLALAVFLWPLAASARSEKTVAYPRDEAWPCAVRFIRVDAGLKVTEKDADAGYVLFELHEEKRTFRGSLEVIDVVEDGRHETKLVMQIEDRPSWVEDELLNRLEQKLRTELGSPEPPPTPRDPKPEPARPDPPKADAPKPPADDDGPPISPTP